MLHEIGTRGPISHNPFSRTDGMMHINYAYYYITLSCAIIIVVLLVVNST